MVNLNIRVKQFALPESGERKRNLTTLVLVKRDAVKRSRSRQKVSESRKCLVIWCGDHKQTPGGLRKTDEAKAFRRKLLRRPIALRGDTKHFQPNMLGKVVLRYLDGMDEPLINRVQVILRATLGGRSVSSEEDIVTLQLLCQEVGCPYHEELRSTACSVALVVLWMDLHQEKFPLATTLQAAAGVSGPQKWALILPSSARVSLVTYTAVIAVRYPELDNVQNDLICFGNYLLGEQATGGGFLPLFWDAPSAYVHAATDIGSAVDWLQSQVELSSDENGCLAVLHILLFGSLVSNAWLRLIFDT